MERVDCIIVGAGIIGIAIARALAKKGREVIVLDKAPCFGFETSSRNSEVIHSGIYYPPNSLKATTCVNGKEAIYRFCEDRGVPFKKLGKFIIAVTSEQIEMLKKIKNNAEMNGVDDLQYLSKHEVLAVEPNLSCSAALYSPSSGIVDTHSLMLSMLGEAEAHGAQFVYHTNVLSGYAHEDCVEVVIDDLKLRANLVINAAGLGAPALAKCFINFPQETIPMQFYAKGNYFSYKGNSPFQHLIYPTPEPGGLGIHITMDMGNRVRFGPDVEWVDQIDYTVNASRAENFYTAIRKYWPGLADSSLEPDYAGIRPKLHGPHQNKATDFEIHGKDIHGCKSIINLYGIESPGITSSLAIADYVARLAQVQIQ